MSLDLNHERKQKSFSPINYLAITWLMQVSYKEKGRNVLYEPFLSFHSVLVTVEKLVIVVCSHPILSLHLSCSGP